MKKESNLRQNHPMNSKQRVLNAISHRSPDRVPRDLSVVPEVAEAICSRLGVKQFSEVVDRLELDIRHVFPRYEGPLHFAPRTRVFKDGTWEDIWGVRYRTVRNISGGSHEEVITHPLAEAKTAAEVEKYPWPNIDCYDFSQVTTQCKTSADYALLGGYAHFLCPGADFRGYETWLMDLAEGSSLAHAMLAKMEEFWLAYSNCVYEASEGHLDIFYMADDYGMQDRMLISPACWRRAFKPIVERFMRWAHERGLHTMLHSCGSIRPIIPDLIDCGLEILDPVQPLARDMSPYELKKEFGRDLCFHGGVDIQELLPHGTPAEVQAEVQRLIGVVGESGGYILCPAHQVQSDVPVENILAMYFVR